jgi:hypothetical protein
VVGCPLYASTKDEHLIANKGACATNKTRGRTLTSGLFNAGRKVGNGNAHVMNGEEKEEEKGGRNETNQVNVFQTPPDNGDSSV